MRQNLCLNATILSFVLLLGGQTAQAEQSPQSEAKSNPGVFRVSTGVSFSSGDYGDTSKTNVFSTTIGAKYSNGPFSIRLTVPYVRISGPGSIVDTPEGRGGGSGRGSNSGSGSSNSGSGGSSVSSGAEIIGGATRQTSSGLGDISVGATYSFDLGDELYLDASARVKLPTASVSKRLGTGKTDVTAALDVTKYFGPVGVYAGGRHRFVGKSATSALRDTWGATIGASFDASDKTTIGVDYDWQQSSFADGKSIQEATAWATLRLSKQLSMNLYGSTGFNSNSVDAAGGLTLTWRF